MGKLIPKRSTTIFKEKEQQSIENEYKYHSNEQPLHIPVELNNTSEFTINLHCYSKVLSVVHFGVA